MLEKEIERHLRECVKSLGGWCLKFVTPGFTGVPDRIILLPGGVIAFVELKRPGQVERQRQQFVQSRLRRLGFYVFSSVNSQKRMDEVIRWCEAKMAGVDG